MVGIAIFAAFAGKFHVTTRRELLARQLLADLVPDRDHGGVAAHLLGSVRRRLRTVYPLECVIPRRQCLRVRRDLPRLLACDGGRGVRSHGFREQRV